MMMFTSTDLKRGVEKFVHINKSYTYGHKRTKKWQI
jgi:hypothetical protein